MKKQAFVIALVLTAAVPTAILGAQRFGRDRGMQRLGAGAAVTPAQVWRLTTLTMEQRKRLHDVQTSTFERVRDAREAGAGDRRDLAGALRDMQGRVESVVTPAQLDQARANPREPLTPEELIYYPITSLTDLDPARRAKIDAVFAPAIAEARGGPRRGEAEKGAERQRRIALFEVLDALLTTDQMVAVKQFLPEQLRNAGLRERIVYRLPSLTLEQEAKARAAFAALDDETAADRARLKAINNELGGKDKDVAPDKRKSLVEERRQINERVEVREKRAYADLSAVLTPEQMKQLAAQKPGPPRPVVFTPEAIRALTDLTPEQQRRIRDAMQSFMRGTKDERAEVRELGKQAKGADLQSTEMAGVRDRLRHAAEVLDVERDRVTRTIADTLTGAQLARLVEESAGTRKAGPKKKLTPPPLS